MLKIGNIIYNKELVNHIKQEFINYYEYDNIKDIDCNLPTLIVGWQNVRTFPYTLPVNYEISILEKELIKNKLYWEFSFEENKSNHIDGVESFVYNLPYYYFDSKYEYILIDPVFNQIKEFDQLITYLPNNIDRIYSYKNEMLYILSDNKIYGIDLKMFDFFKFDVKILTQILNNDSKAYKYIYDEGNIYNEYYKIYYFYINLKRHLVVLI